MRFRRGSFQNQCGNIVHRVKKAFGKAKSERKYFCLKETIIQKQIGVKAVCTYIQGSQMISSPAINFFLLVQFIIGIQQCTNMRAYESYSHSSNTL